MILELEKLPAALLLDLDGTVADSRMVLRACFDSFLLQRGIKARQSDFDALDGVSVLEIPLRLQERFGIDEPIKRLRSEYERSVESAYESVQPARGARELVDVATQLGVLLVLVTSAPGRLAARFLESAGLSRFMAAVVSGEDGPPKPDPGLFQVALSRAPTQPGSALAVEDSPAGVHAARAAGLPVVGVSSEVERAAALATAGAFVVVSDLSLLAASLMSVRRSDPS